MFLKVVILLVGFLFLVKGADWFVEGAASIAKKLGIPQLIIGLTIVAMGTSMPEAAMHVLLQTQQSLNLNFCVPVHMRRKYRPVLRQLQSHHTS